MACAPVLQRAKTPGIWNPLPYFDTVQQDGEIQNVTDVSNYFKAAKDGTLPAVSWIAPSGPNSEHPPALVSQGQAWVTGLINAAMQSPERNSTAIFLAGARSSLLRTLQLIEAVGRRSERPTRVRSF